MPNYVAQTPGIQPAPRPAIDVGDIIGAASKAFQANKEGILTRAVMQHNAARSNAELSMQQEHQDAELMAQGWHPPTQPSATAAPSYPSEANQPPPAADTPAIPNAPMGVQPPSAAPAIVAPPTSAIPTTALPPAAARSVTTSSAPAPITLGGTGRHANWELGLPLQVQRSQQLRQQALQAANQSSPGMFSEAEIQLASHDDRAYDQAVRRIDTWQQAKNDRDQRTQALNGATDAHGKPLSDAVIQGLAHDPIAFRKYLDTAVAPPEDKIATHRAERQIDANIPLRQPGEDPATKRADAYVASRIHRLTAPGPKDAAGQPTPGLDFDAAQAQAVQEAGKLYGKAAISSYQQPDTPPPSEAHDAIGEEIVKRIQAKHGTIEQAIAAGVNPASIAYAKRKLGVK